MHKNKHEIVNIKYASPNLKNEIRISKFKKDIYSRI